MAQADNIVSQALITFLSDRAFPCVAAKDALTKGNLKIMTADHLACPKDDRAILSFIYEFTEWYRKSEKGFYSAAIVFKEPGGIDETLFDTLMWQRLQALRNLDAVTYTHDNRVSSDPTSAKFSFSLMEEAFFIVGLHPESSRPARKFMYPTLVFNPHDQFEKLKQHNRYDKMKKIVRNRDVAFSGSINPMLTDFGEASEVYQYSGRNYNSDWRCPLNTNFAK